MDKQKQKTGGKRKKRGGKHLPFNPATRQQGEGLRRRKKEEEERRRKEQNRET